MKKPDVNRLQRAAEHIQTAILYIEKVYLHVESWQGYRTKQHLNALRDEYVSLKTFADLMQREPNFQHRNWLTIEKTKFIDKSN